MRDGLTKKLVRPAPRGSIELGSTNGLAINDRVVQAGDIEHGDRIDIGGLTFQFVIEEHDVEPDVYELPSE